MSRADDLRAAKERAGIALRALINEVEAEHRAAGIPVQGGDEP